MTSNWREACEKAGVPANSLKYWLAHEPAFQKAYNSLLGPAVEVARDMIESTAVRAAGMYDEAIDAIKGIDCTVVCPACQHEFSAKVGEPDWAARLRAGDTVLKVSRILKDVKEIGATITHLSVEESLALARLKYALDHGIAPDIPPHMMEKIRPHLREEPTHADDPVAVVDDR